MRKVWMGLDGGVWIRGDCSSDRCYVVGAVRGNESGIGVTLAIQSRL